MVKKSSKQFQLTKVMSPCIVEIVNIHDILMWMSQNRVSLRLVDFVKKVYQIKNYLRYREVYFQFKYNQK